MNGRTPGVHPSKMARVKPVPAANLIVQLQSETSERAGPQLDVPQNITPAQLEILLNGLLTQEDGDKLPYSFHIQDMPLLGELGAHLQAHKVSVETVVQVVFQPQAVFRVRPLTRCTASLPGHKEAVLCVAFSPCGRHLASGSGDTTMRLWDLGTNMPAHTCTAHRAWVLCVVWAPDSNLIASGDMNGLIWLWKPDSNDPVGCCKGHTKWITSIAWEPAHKALPSRRFVSGSKDASIRIWDANTRRCTLTMSSHSMAISCVRWGGEDLLYSASRDCVINVWHAQDGHLVRTLKGHGHWVNTLALSTEHALRSGAFDHHGNAPKAAKEAQQTALERWQEACRGQPERLASGSDDFTMYLWEASTSSKPLGRMTGHVQLINQVQFSPDGRWIATASFDKAVKLWDGVKGSFVGTLRCHVGPVYQLAWSSDSRLVVSASKDSTLKVWDAASRKLKEDLPGHADEVFCVDWSPTGGAAASGGKDCVLRLWKH
ncbi:hypothetical protein WJX73_005187 [Symbiochloris irregularis]|uniref:NLE domain-containing protein n=1 Tax=Symbiochloris irregularis TaxID=706552 RepID=A0AAW1PIU5_9CHLO